MARIVDFNINQSKHRPMNNNACNVVINNNSSTEQPKYPTEVCYNPPDLNNYQSVNPVQVQNQTENNVNMEELYKLLAITFSNILKDNNPKLIANIIDNSGKIIVDAQNLIQIIALITASHETDIHIEYVSNDSAGCTACTKINPIKKIENIKIGYVDFKLGFNDKYNILSDTFNISLRKCIIPIGIVYA